MMDFSNPHVEFLIFTGRKCGKEAGGECLPIDKSAVLLNRVRCQRPYDPI